MEKNNYGTYGTPAVAFELTAAPGDPSRATIAWRGEVAGIRAGDLVGQLTSADERSDREDALEFLRAELAGGPRRVRELEDEAAAASIGWTTVKKVKKDAKIVSKRLGGAGDQGWWEWSLPRGDATESPLAEAAGVPLSEIPDGECDLGRPDTLRGTDTEGVPLRPLRGGTQLATPTPDDLERWESMAGSEGES